MVIISSFGSIYFQKYKLWKLGFFTSHEINLKHVFLVQLSHLKLENSKLSATDSTRKKIDRSISNQNFKSRPEKLDMLKVVQVRSLERNKNKKFLKSYHNFLLAHWNLVKPMALQIRYIGLLRIKISCSEGPKFQRYFKKKVGQQDNIQTRVFKGMLT